MKRAMTWVAIGLIIFGVLLGGVVALGIFGDWSFNFGGLVQSTATLANRQTFTAEEFARLEIVYRSDDVTFEVSAGGEFVLEEYMTNPAEVKYARISEGSDTLRIEQGDRSGDWFMFYNTHYAKIYIPADWHGDFDAQCSSGSLRSEADWQFASINLQANSGSLKFNGLESAAGVTMTTTSGSVKADSITAAGGCTLQASSGSVKVGRVQAGAPLTATTTSGSLKFERVAAPDVRMQANSGSVKVEDLTGTFDLSTTSGSINVESGAGHGSAVASSGSVKINLSSVTGDMHLETTSGSVRFNMPSGYSFTFQGDTTSGSLKTPFDDQLSYNEKGNHAEGTVGEDAGLHICCKASSGSVRVEY